MNDLLISSGADGITISLGLLLLRLFTGVFMLTHGLPKLRQFTVYAQRFPPIAGNAKISLSLSIFAEVVCTGLVILGLFTRLAAVPLIINMGVAVFRFHGKDPFAKKEMALLYGIVFLVLMLSGAGIFSLDYLFAIKS